MITITDILILTACVRRNAITTLMFFVEFAQKVIAHLYFVSVWYLHLNLLFFRSVGLWCISLVCKKYATKMKKYIYTYILQFWFIYNGSVSSEILLPEPDSQFSSDKKAHYNIYEKRIESSYQICSICRRGLHSLSAVNRNFKKKKNK